MSRSINNLSATKIKAASFSGKPQKLSDGGGLYLYVNGTGKYWRQKYRFNGKEKTASHGVYPEVSLADARERRDAARKLLAKGIDPVIYKRVIEKESFSVAGNTFKSVALEWMKSLHSARVSPGHARTCLKRLENYAFPAFGKSPISTITAGEVLHALKPIAEAGKRETAKRVLIVCGQVFRYAVQSGRADRDVTLDLRDALPPAKPRHHPAITDPAQIGELLRAIDGYEGLTSTHNALKLAPLLFVRPGELRSMQWKDINLETAEWDYRPSKNGTPFIFPLSHQAVQLLKSQQRRTGEGRYVFPSVRGDARPMSNNTLNAALQNLGFKGVMTAHGFRAMARTILDETLGFRPEYIEQQLAHKVRDTNGRAYNRTSYLKQRKEMMQRWADYLDTLRSDE